MKPVYHVFTRSSVDFSGVPKAEISHYKWEEGYAPKAFAQLLYVDGLGFALHMEVEEQDPKAVYTMYNQDVYKDSCMEFFVNFNPAQTKYINFEMNSNGAFLSALRADRHDKTPIHQILSDLPAVRAEKGNGKWSVDAFFTLGQIETLFGKGAFQKGDEFCGNFYKCGDETPIPHYGMWSPVELEKPDFHQPAFFGTFVID